MNKRNASTRRGAEPKEAGQERPSGADPTKLRPVRFTINLPTSLVDEVRDAVLALSGPPYLLTLSAFTREAFGRELKRLREKANRGRSFPRRAEGQRLRRGRPIGL